MCLLTSQQRSGPNTPVAIFLRQNDFPLTYNNVFQNRNDVNRFVSEILVQNNLKRYINRIPNFFSANFHYLENSNWKIFNNIENRLDGNAIRDVERVIADQINDTLSGFGPKQSRNFLQSLGLTKYEIPIDSRITSWLNDFGFPVSLSSSALQDKGYYHFVSDGIQILCEKSEVYPCIFDAVVFSSFDNGNWNKGNIVF